MYEKWLYEHLFIEHAEFLGSLIANLPVVGRVDNSAHEFV